MKKCIVLGGSGLIGQQFIRMISEHPKFDMIGVYASSATEGKTIEEIWSLPHFSCPEQYKNLIFRNLDTVLEDSKSGNTVDLVFSGLPSSIALDLEGQLREQGLPVFSNTSAYRMDPEVPILIPETNPNGIELVKAQIAKYGGFIVTSPNCSTTGASMYLKEIENLLDFDTIVISTYQALSGAGANGVSSLQAISNVIPHINMEEEKIKQETRKILGSYKDGIIEDAEYEIVVNCARVPVIDGHLEAISVRATSDFDLDKIKNDLKNLYSPFIAEGSLEQYYTAPIKHLIYLAGQDRPQHRMDNLTGDGRYSLTRGMAISVGRLRKDGNWLSAYVLVHNTIRGGAGDSLLNAEFLINKGII